MKNMIITEFNLCPNVLYERKEIIDQVLYDEFDKKFKKMLNFYKSLSTSNSYRKVQKISIIKTPQTDDTILNLLNKITDTNYERISQKVLLKLTQNTIENFINQILKYSEKANKNNSILLWKLLNSLYLEYKNLFPDIAIKTKIIITDLINKYIEVFLEEFDINPLITCDYKNKSKEEYNEFVKRNMNNSALLSRLYMICDITHDKLNIFNINLTTSDIFYRLLKVLRECVETDIRYKENFENITNNVLECLYQILLSNNKFDIVNLNNILEELKSIQKVNNLSNKNKFKLLDILDGVNVEIKKLGKNILYNR